jgi:hypothetical protein
LETSPSTSKIHIQAGFYFNLRVYETTLKKWMEKYDFYGWLKPCKDVEGFYFYTRKGNNFDEVGDYSKIKFRGECTDVEEVFQMVNE